jgi:hypothetical protein
MTVMFSRRIGAPAHACCARRWVKRRFAFSRLGAAVSGLMPDGGFA